MDKSIENIIDSSLIGGERKRRSQNGTSNGVDRRKGTNRTPQKEYDTDRALTVLTVIP